MRDEKLTADPVQGVAPPASMPESLLLDAAADLIEGGVGQTHGVEVIHHQLGVRQPVGQPACVTGGRGPR